MGYIMKENCLEEYQSLIKQKNLRQKQLKKEKKKKNENSFLEFNQLKEFREKAIQCLHLMAKPREQSSLKDNGESPELSLCIAVGKALKGIDRNLFPEWADWCNFILSREEASTLWDYFSPRSCEVHSTTHSQVTKY